MILDLGWTIINTDNVTTVVKKVFNTDIVPDNFMLEINGVLISFGDDKKERDRIFNAILDCLQYNK